MAWPPLLISAFNIIKNILSESPEKKAAREARENEQKTAREARENAQKAAREARENEETNDINGFTNGIENLLRSEFKAKVSKEDVAKFRKDVEYVYNLGKPEVDSKSKLAGATLSNFLEAMKGHYNQQYTNPFRNSDMDLKMANFYEKLAETAKKQEQQVQKPMQKENKPEAEKTKEPRAENIRDTGSKVSKQPNPRVVDGATKKPAQPGVKNETLNAKSPENKVFQEAAKLMNRTNATQAPQSAGGNSNLPSITRASQQGGVSM